MIAEMKLFKKISDEINSGVYDFTDNGKCTQCGACCSNYLPMTQAEIATIHRFMKSMESRNLSIYFQYPVMLTI